MAWRIAGLMLLGLQPGFGQRPGKYLVLLRDKAGTPYSLDQPGRFLSSRSVLRRQKQAIPLRERDLPVNPSYVTQIREAGAKIWFTSRWLNAVLVEADKAVIDRLQALPVVKGLEFGRSLANARLDAPSQPLWVSRGAEQAQKFGVLTPLDYGTAQAQIVQLGVDKMHQQGYRGEGMLIAVLDGGFQRADRVPFLKPLFDQQRVLATYDFVRKKTTVYEEDAHGMSCLSALAATADGSLYGTAFGAGFILLRTEDVASESRVEEANWLFGAEYADSAGVDIISSSLGYSQFDDVSTNYTYAQMDGKTALSSRAAQLASETGMVVVVAAGNEGRSPWRFISAPSDAAGVLAIGAVDQNGAKADFSSFGPSADGRVKPDLAARGQGTVVGQPDGRIVMGNGTSFATPLIAGLAAGFWQAHPTLTAVQVTALLRRSGSQFGQPDDELGYGIPNFERASHLADVSDRLQVFNNPFSETEPLSVFWGSLEPNATLDATLSDLTGRVLWRRQRAATTGEEAQLSLPNLNLSVGMYFLTLLSGDKKQTVKVIKR